MKTMETGPPCMLYLLSLSRALARSLSFVAVVMHSHLDPNPHAHIYSYIPQYFSLAFGYSSVIHSFNCFVGATIDINWFAWLSKSMLRPATQYDALNSYCIIFPIASSFGAVRNILVNWRQDRKTQNQLVLKKKIITNNYYTNTL